MAIIATCLGHEAGGFMGNQEGTTAGQVILGTKQQAAEHCLTLKSTLQDLHRI